jgi:hypothetical protein
MLGKQDTKLKKIGISGPAIGYLVSLDWWKKARSQRDLLVISFRYEEFARRR